MPTCSTTAQAVVTIALALIGALGTGLTAWFGFKLKQLDVTTHVIQKQTDRRKHHMSMPPELEKRKEEG